MMLRRSNADRRRGLTLVEVLVAIVILAVVATAVVGTFSAIVQMTQDASEDVDYSRVVRSTMERIRTDWSAPDSFQSELVNVNVSVAAFVSDFSDGACSGVVSPDPVVSVVKRVTITCGAGARARTYVQEFGTQ